MAESSTPPITTASIVDFAWGLSFYFSDNEQERRYGEDLKTKWDTMLSKFANDSQSYSFLQSVNAAMAATIYNLAQIRHQATDHFAFLDLVQKQNLQNLDDLANLSKDAESIATRLAGISIGGVTFLTFASKAVGQDQFAYFILGAGVFYFLFEAILRVIKSWRAPMILEQTQRAKEAFITTQIEPKYQDQLSNLVQKVDKIAQDGTKAIFKRELMATKGITDVSHLVTAERNLSDLVNTSAHMQANAFVTGTHVLTGAECVMIARRWVQSGFGALQLRNWTDKINEGDKTVQVKGTVDDEYVPQHEYDVRVSKEDGKVLEGSYVR